MQASLRKGVRRCGSFYWQTQPAGSVGWLEPKTIQTGVSRKKRSEDEMIMLMRTAQRRFEKAVAEGKIVIVSKREWILR